MAPHSDQLHSHQFTRHRVVGALALRDPDPPLSPLRRVGGALLAGALGAALALAAVGVYGLLRPAGGSWREGGSVIIERETGARFVYADGVLHPVLNYSSALLILRTAAPSVTVARAALAGVARGTPLGIPGAPDALPARSDLVEQAWTVCSRAGAPSVPSIGSQSVPSIGAQSVLTIGAPPAADAARLAEDRGVLGADPRGGLHLIWHDRRYPVDDPDLVLAAFAWPRGSVVPLAPALLNALPTGASLGRVAIDRSGRPSPVEGLASGQVFVVSSASGGRQYGVAQPGGLAELTPAQADLLSAEAGPPTTLSSARFAAAPKAPSLVPTGVGAPPATAPSLVTAAGVCATVGGAVEVTVRSGPPRGAAESRAPKGSTVDYVAVAPGHGAVVEALAGPAAPVGALALVTDAGLRFPVPSPEVLGMLGFGGVTPVRLPAAVVALLPAGRALDPVAAAQPA